VPDGVDKRDQPFCLLDDPGPVPLAVGVLHPDHPLLVEPVHPVGEVRRQPALDLVWLDIEIAPSATLAVVGLSGDQ
jgi:hypothetical protein